MPRPKWRRAIPRETEAVIIGGGNSAGQAAMFPQPLRELRTCLGPWHISCRLHVALPLESRLEADPGITIEYGAEVSALHGVKHLEAVSIRNVKTGETRVVEARALFVMVGAASNSEWLSAGLVKLDDKGFVITGSGEGSATSPFATSAARHLRGRRCACSAQ